MWGRKKEFSRAKETRRRKILVCQVFASSLEREEKNCLVSLILRLAVLEHTWSWFQKCYNSACLFCVAHNWLWQKIRNLNILNTKSCSYRPFFHGITTATCRHILDFQLWLASKCWACSSHIDSLQCSQAFLENKVWTTLEARIEACQVVFVRTTAEASAIQSQSLKNERAKEKAKIEHFFVPPTQKLKKNKKKN